MTTSPLLARASRHPLVRLVRRLHPIRWQATGAYGAMLVASGIALVVPIFLRDVIDAAIGSRPEALGFLPAGLDDRQRLLVGAGLVVVLGLVRAVVSFWQRYGTAWVGRTVATDLRRDLLDHLVDDEMAFHDRSSVGELMTRVTDDTEQVRAFAATGVADLANILALLVGTGVLLWGLDPVLAPIPLGAVPVVAALGILGARLLTPRFRSLQSARGGLSARLQESLTQVRVVQAFHAEDRTADAYEETNEVVFERRLVLARIFTSVFPAMSGVLGLATALVLLEGGQRVADGTTTVGTVVAFTTYVTLLGEPVRRLGFLLNLASRATASTRRVLDLLDRPPPHRPADGPSPSGDGVLRWEGVRFGYGASTVLHDVDLAVAPGEHVAVVGRSGSGKTTLLQLLLGLYEPDEGRVSVDGVDVRDVPEQDLRRLVASVEQDVWLFSATIAENIRYARPEASDEDVEHAARLAGLHGFVSGLDDGYDTLVGERGVTLSGGQRQRVALARALLVGAPVLVLDDAVSAIDAGTERAIRAALAGRDGRLTVVSVAQRQSTIRAADRIVVLEEGRVVEQGTHDELLAAGGAYATLFADDRPAGVAP